MKDDPRKPPKSEKTSTSVSEGSLARFGLKLASWCERWFPDPLVFALAGVVLVFIFGLLLHQSPAKLAIQGGKNFGRLSLSPCKW